MGSLKNEVCFHIFWYYLYLHQCFKLKKQQVENVYMMTYTIEVIILYD